MPKLTASQLIVLSKAAARDDGAAVTPQGMGKAPAAKVGSSLIAALLRWQFLLVKQPICRRQPVTKSTGCAKATEPKWPRNRLYSVNVTMPFLVMKRRVIRDSTWVLVSVQIHSVLTDAPVTVLAKERAGSPRLWLGACRLW